MKSFSNGGWFAHPWFLAILALVLHGVCGQALGQASRQLVDLPVYSAPAADLVEILRPLVGDGALIAHHDRLIVRGTDAEIAAVKEGLERLDRPVRRLMVEVRQAGQGVGDSRRYGTNRPPLGGGGRQVSTLSRNQLIQRVQTLDGHAALIRTGEERPVRGAVAGWSGRHPGEQGGVIVPGGYQSIDSGFYALPRVHGDQVTVELYQQDEQALPRGRVQGSSARTVLRGDLGDWLDVGGEQREDAEGARRWSTVNEAERRLQIRVQALD